MVNPDRVLKAVSAINDGDLKTLRMMLKAGVPANHFIEGTYASDRSSLAHLAARQGQWEIFELLIASGAGIDEQEQCSWRPPVSMLECACSATKPSLDIVQKILTEGQPNQDHLNAALLAAAYSHLGCVEQLLSAGADPNVIDPAFDTPLIIAVIASREDIACRLVEAGADASLMIRNKDRDKFWKKTIVDVATRQGMAKLLSMIQAASPAAGDTGQAKPKRVNKPKTVEQCWQTIDQWLNSHAGEVKLPAPFDWTQKPTGMELLETPAAKQLRESLSCHDGTGDLAIVVMSGDAAYSLLSVRDALSTREMMREISENEGASRPAEQWPEHWLPIAHNGGGDLLLIDCSELNAPGQVLRFDHEMWHTTRYKKSMLSLLQEIAVDLERGVLSYDERYGLQ